MTRPNFEKQKKRLKSLIVDAFTGTNYPEESQVCSSIAGDYELEELLACAKDWDNDWRNIPSELVCYDYSALSFLSSDGYSFFIPAYLLNAIESIGSNKSSEYDMLLMSVMYDLCGHCDPSDELFEYVQYRHSKLTQKQKRAIHEFLHFVLIYSNDDEYIKLAQKTIALGIYINI